MAKMMIAVTVGIDRVPVDGVYTQECPCCWAPSTQVVRLAIGVGNVRSLRVDYHGCSVFTETLERSLRERLDG